MRIVLLLGIFFISLIFLACTPKSVPVENATIPQALPKELKSPIKETWQAEWERTLALAKKEGAVVISSRRSAEAQQKIEGAFANKYPGIAVIWISGPTQDRAARIAAERRAGIYYNDVGIDGANVPLTTYNHKWGILEPLPPFFILPEVKEPSGWLNGEHPFIDSKRMYNFSLTLYPQAPITANTDLANPAELNSYKSLLDPKWKGKFSSKDPTIVGGANKWFQAMTEEDFGPILGLDYMRALAKQEPVIIRDDRIAGEWILRGKYAFGLNHSLAERSAEWRNQGIRVPLEEVTPKEGGYVTSGGQTLYFFKNAPHPNAARIFINWLLSKEGAKALTIATIKHSARVDIGDPREIIPEVIMRVPGRNYVNPDQEKYLLKTDEVTDRAREIFRHLLK